MVGLRWKGAAVGLALAVLCAYPALAAETSCNITGWSEDKDPAGLNVRAGPSKNARVIAVLPPETDYAVEFDIIASEGGWLKIKDAVAPTYSDAPDRKVFAGPGWVFADKVRFVINDTELRSAPREDAPTVLKLSIQTPDYAQGPDSAMIDHVFGCDGGFADIEVHMDKGPHMRGWADRICNNQVTTCP